MAGKAYSILKNVMPSIFTGESLLGVTHCSWQIDWALSSGVVRNCMVHHLFLLVLLLSPSLSLLLLYYYYCYYHYGYFLSLLPVLKRS